LRHLGGCTSEEESGKSCSKKIVTNEAARVQVIWEKVRAGKNPRLKLLGRGFRIILLFLAVPAMVWGCEWIKLPDETDLRRAREHSAAQRARRSIGFPNL
jgi:hypothetical protein